MTTKNNLLINAVKDYIKEKNGFNNLIFLLHPSLYKFIDNREIKLLYNKKIFLSFDFKLFLGIIPTDKRIVYSSYDADITLESYYLKHGNYIYSVYIYYEMKIINIIHKGYAYASKPLNAYNANYISFIEACKEHRFKKFTIIFEDNINILCIINNDKELYKNYIDNFINIILEVNKYVYYVIFSITIISSDKKNYNNLLKIIQKILESRGDKLNNVIVKINSICSMYSDEYNNKTILLETINNGAVYFKEILNSKNNIHKKIIICKLFLKVLFIKSIIQLSL